MKYTPERIAWELDETSSNRSYYGNALRVAKDFTCLDAEDRTTLDAWLDGSIHNDPRKNISIGLQIIAMKIRESN